MDGGTTTVIATLTGLVASAGVVWLSKQPRAARQEDDSVANLQSSATEAPPSEMPNSGRAPIVAAKAAKHRFYVPAVLLVTFIYFVTALLVCKFVITIWFDPSQERLMGGLAALFVVISGVTHSRVNAMER